jgi:hypothetical protein
MKRKVAYITKDDEVFFNETEAIEHEAKLMGLTLDEYRELENLEQVEKDCSLACSCTRSEETEQAFTIAINNVVAFRKEHNLPLTENLDD